MVNALSCFPWWYRLQRECGFQHIVDRVKIMHVSTDSDLIGNGKRGQKFKGMDTAVRTMDMYSSDKLPKSFICPITGEVFQDPVMTMDGHTYERSAITRWLQDNDTSPLTHEYVIYMMILFNPRVF